MGVSKETKDKIMNLVLQNVPTDTIACELNYSIGTVRKVLEELREEYGVNTTKEIVNIYLDQELAKLNNHIANVRKLLKKSQNCDYAKSRPHLQKRQNQKKS